MYVLGLLGVPLEDKKKHGDVDLRRQVKKIFRVQGLGCRAQSNGLLYGACFTQGAEA